MSRTRTIPDATIFAEVMAGLTATGGKGVSFGVIGKSCGLAASTLAQRFGSVEGMIRAALSAEWQALIARTAEAEQTALVSAKGAQGFLKMLAPPGPTLLAASLQDEALRALAESWRAQVEAALVPRLGGGSRGREAAALIFAAWQGRADWEAVGGKGFRLGDLFKRLA